MGASFDTPSDNLAFKVAQGFEYPLLSDVDRSVGAQYGVVRDGGKYADYPQRHSFLIDPVGVVRKAYDVDDVAGHAAKVLADLDRLQAA